MKIELSVLLVCLSMSVLPAMAQDKTDESTEGLLRRVERIMAEANSHGVDTNYIQIPKEPWQVSVKSRVAQTDLQMHSTIDGGAVYGPILEGTGISVAGPLLVKPRVMTPVSSSVGVKVGYRGLSASYMFPLGGDKGRSLSLRSIGRFHSIHLRWHQFEEESPEVPGSLNMQGLSPEVANLMDFIPGPKDEAAGTQQFSFLGKWNLTSPIKIKTLVFDGFYILTTNTSRTVLPTIRRQSRNARQARSLQASWHTMPTSVSTTAAMPN